jgi:quercetin dioxygenase-like cupin family protein
MPRNGQALLCVDTLPMDAGATFSWHSHDTDQLAWADRGVLTVRAQAGTWVLPPTRALWIPAGIEHETSAVGLTAMKGIYLEPTGRSLRWPAPQPIAMTPLLAGSSSTSTARASKPGGARRPRR